jgi:hypothetical protein
MEVRRKYSKMTEDKFHIAMKMAAHSLPKKSKIIPASEGAT